MDKAGVICKVSAFQMQNRINFQAAVKVHDTGLVRVMMLDASCGKPCTAGVLLAAIGGM